MARTSALDDAGCDDPDLSICALVYVHSARSSDQCASWACIGLHGRFDGLFRHLDEQRGQVIRLALLCLFIAGCTPLNLLSGGGGGNGVSVTPIGTQIAKEATQQAVGQQNETTAGRDVIRTEVIKEVEAGQVDRVNISNQNIPPWVLLLLVLGWLLPTPQAIGIWLGDIFMRLIGKTNKIINKRDQPQESKPISDEKQIISGDESLR